MTEDELLVVRLIESGVSELNVLALRLGKTPAQVQTALVSVIRALGPDRREDVISSLRSQWQAEEGS